MKKPARSCAVLVESEREARLTFRAFAVVFLDRFHEVHKCRTCARTYATTTRRIAKLDPGSFLYTVTADRDAVVIDIDRYITVPCNGDAK